MRICRVINAMWTGGVQMRLLELLPRLKDRGAHVEIVTTRVRGEVATRLEREHGIQTKCLRIRRRLRPDELWRLARYFSSRRLDVVHTHMYAANIPATVAARLAGVPCVVGQLHNVRPYKKWHQAMTDRALLPWRDAMLTVSEAVSVDAARQMRLGLDSFDVLYNGIEDRPLPNADMVRRHVRAELAVDEDAFVVVHAARLHPQKGHRAFLETWPRILAAEPKAVLLLAGAGDEAEPLRARAAELGVAGSVRLLGNREDVPRLMTASDVSILPSQKEGFSNVVLESMVHHAALVITDVGGAREQLRDGVDGLVIPPGDPQVFADAVIRLAREPQTRARLADSAHERVRLFGLDTMADRTMALYEEILSRRAGSSRFALLLPRLHRTLPPPQPTQTS